MSIVLVVLEISKGKLISHSKECMTVAKNLADQMGGELNGVIIGHEISSLAEEVTKYGLKKVYKADAPELKGINLLYHIRVISDLIQQIQPAVIMAGASLYGKEMIPRLTARHGTWLISDAKTLQKEGDKLVGTRGIFEEKLVGTMSANLNQTVFVTISSGNNPEAEMDDSLSGEVIDFKLNLQEGDKREEFIEEKIAEVSVDITKAKLLVSGGRGCGSKEKFSIIFDTAKALGGQVAASRAVVDLDWVPYDHEVGQTGKIVTPDFYIACGISGAMQHLVGMRNSKCIIAVNTDEEAPILEVAHYAIIEDLHKILPELINQV
ncbi:MAG: electron transfer flavoprotein subunit alpha/FixB family protein [Candidatus Hodarchaeota archaeon]